MKRCPKCSKLYSDFVNYCSDCGTPLSDNDTVSTNSAGSAGNFFGQQYNGGAENYSGQQYNGGAGNYSGQQYDGGAGNYSGQQYDGGTNNYTPVATPQPTGSGDSMKFFEAVKTCFKKYADFSGRARRSEYWWFALFNMAVGFILYFLASVTYSNFLLVIYSVYTLAIIIPGLAAAVRRLHDVGKKGTYYFMILIPIYGPIKLIITFATDSMPGDNAFGPCPKQF